MSASAKSASVPKSFWSCGYCQKLLGADHRNCICRGYHYSVEAWQKDAEARGRRAYQQANIVLDKELPFWVKKKHSQAILPPGTYYIGDLCYLMRDDIYHGVWGDKCNYTPGSYTNGKALFVVDNTAYGDGSYKGTDGFSYLVDAGIIGIMNAECFDKGDPTGRGGTVHTFTEPVFVTMGMRDPGHFEFKSGDWSLTIKTGGYWDGEESPY